MVWFLEQLKWALGGESGNFGNWTIMSDRQKGLLNAVDEVFPTCHQRFYLRHIYANFQSAGFKGKDLKKLFDRTAYAYDKPRFDKAVEMLKEEDAWQWVSNIPMHHWARHDMDTNCKTDLVINNLSEVFNKFILDVRDKPVVTMVDQIRTKLMCIFHTKREGVRVAQWDITPNYAEKLEIAKVESRMCKPFPATGGLWQVESGDKKYAVNIDAATCGCRRWDISGLPCKHAIACIYKRGLEPEDFVNEFFKKPMFEAAYEPIIFPVPGQHGWTKTAFPDIDPPIFTRHPGRRKKNRRKGVHEVPQASGKHRMTTTTCSNCGIQGHKYPNCNLELKPELQIRKSKHKSYKRMAEEMEAAPPPPRRSPRHAAPAAPASPRCQPAAPPPPCRSPRHAAAAPFQPPRAAKIAPVRGRGRPKGIGTGAGRVGRSSIRMEDYLNAGQNAGPGVDNPNLKKQKKKKK